MTEYVVNFTNISTTPISISEGEIDTSSVDLSLFGRIFLEYGEDLNENLLHLLENFSCPSDSSGMAPDLNKTNHAVRNYLLDPIAGQLWYNSTNSNIHFWNETQWMPIPSEADLAANFGVIGDREYLPRPISSDGYVFPYDECIWCVSPATSIVQFDGLNCLTDSNGRVTMEYSYGTSNRLSGLANYLIIGIRNNELSAASNLMDAPYIGFTVTPTPSPTSTLTNLTPTPSVTASPSPTPLYPSPTPAPTVTPTPAPFAERAALFMSPSECDPGTPGASGTLTYVPDTCGKISINAFNQSIYVSVQNLSGGVQPYTITFNLTADPVVYDPHPTYPVYTGLAESDLSNPTLWEDYVVDTGTETRVGVNYYGGVAGISSHVRVGLVEGEIAYARVRLYNRYFNNGCDWQAGIKLSGSILITDNIGTTKTLWIPSSDDGCPINGIQQYSDSNGIWQVEWKHYGNGDDDGCAECNNCVI